MMDQTSRNDFNNTWLFEMPSGIGSFEIFDAFIYTLKDLISTNIPVIKLDNNLNKIDLPSSVYYWYEQNNEIILGSELHKKPQGLVISVTAKNPKYRGKPPFASNLYKTILKDNSNLNIRILSDTQLSDEGYSIWKSLFKDGVKISVYDRENPGKSFKTFDNIEDMEKYFEDDNSDFKRYQYIMSENIMQIAECKSFFNTRRYRELAGLDLED
jgi:hypothetical protein